MEPVLGGSDPDAWSGHLQPGLRPQHRLRHDRRSSRCGIALETHPAVLLFSHRSYLDGVIVPVAMQENRLPPVHTFAGINLSFGFDGPADAALGRHLHPAQGRRPALQVRAEAVRRLHRGEAVQPELVDRGHSVPQRKDVAAQARSAQLRGRRLPGRAQRGHPAAAGVDQFRPAARDHRIRGLRARRGEDARGPELAVQLHQGPGRAELRQDLRPVPCRGVDAPVPRCSARRDGHTTGRQTPCAAEDGLRGGVADPARHADQRHRAGVGAAARPPTASR